MNTMPKVRAYMTRNPHTVESGASVREALGLMERHRVRHLPVVDGGKLVGLLSLREAQIAAIVGRGSDSLTVREFMVDEPYAVASDTPLDHAILPMAERKLDSVVVQESSGEVVGIFTMVDAIDVLVHSLREHHWPIRVDRATR